MASQFIRAAHAHRRKAVWHIFDQLQASERGKWRAVCGVKIRVLDLDARVESLWGCARCNRSKGDRRG